MLRTFTIIVRSETVIMVVTCAETERLFTNLELIACGSTYSVVNIL